MALPEGTQDHSHKGLCSCGSKERVASATMSMTRRTVLGGALAAPFLTQLAGTAGATEDTSLGTISGGWVELWWTPKSQAQFDLFQATVKPIEPATLVTHNGRKGVRFPIQSATGDPSLTDLSQAHGAGRCAGGMVVQNLIGRFAVTNLRPSLENGVISGQYTLNGVENTSRSLMRCDSSKGRLVAAPVPPGQPQTIRIENVPVYTTPESLAAFEEALGTSRVGLTDVLAYARGEFVYTPPRP